MKKNILLFLIPFSILSASVGFNGIFFKWYPQIHKGSSVVINELPYPTDYDQLEFTFDINFEKPLTYGNLFNLYHNNKELISILYSNDKINNKEGLVFSAPDYSYFEIVKLPDSLLIDQKIAFKIQITKQTASFYINGKRIKKDIKVDSVLSYPSEVILGATPSKAEVTKFTLYQFALSYMMNNDADSILWRFDNFEDKKTFDTSGRYSAELIMATSLIQKHYDWELRNSVVFPRYTFWYFHKNDLSFLALDDSSLYSYSLANSKSKRTALSYVPKIHKGGLLKDKFNNELLYIRSGGGAEVSYFDFKNSEWSYVDTSKYSRDYHSAAYFVSPVDSGLYSWGGYGNYTFKNILQRYDRKKRIWEFVETYGDTIPPRKGSGDFILADSVLLIGGSRGGRSNSQLVESRQLSDLYMLDLKTFYAKKIVDFTTPESSPELLNIIYDDDKKIIYFTLLSDVDESNYLQFYSYDLYTEQINKIGESITWIDNQSISGVTYNSAQNSFYYLIATNEDTLKSSQLYQYDILSKSSFPVGNKLTYKAETAFHFLLFSDKTDELVLIREIMAPDEMKISEIWTLKSPPVTKAEFEKYHPVSNSRNYMIFVIAGFSLIIIFVFIAVKKLATSKPTYLSEGPLKNTIQLLDDLHIYDKYGNNIESAFSVKTLEAFLLIFIKSFKLNNHFNDTGITSADLTNTLWPDYEKDSQKNNRNVTINKIRHLLENIDGIEIVYNKSYWKVKITDELFIDIFEFINVIKNQNNDQFLAFVENYKIGSFCKNISYEWLDPLKLTIDKYLIDSIIALYQQNKKNLNPDEVYKFGTALLMIDNLSEFGIALVLSGHKNNSNKKGYSFAYKQFRKEFFALTGEEFEKSPEELEKIIF